MKLYGSYTSPFVRHCRIALVESALPFDFIEVAAAGPDNPSPTKKIPYFVDGDLGLSDSTSIIKHVREKSGRSFITRTRDWDLFCFVNTLMDSAINVFLFERQDRLMPENSAYLARQVERVERGLDDLETRQWPAAAESDDVLLRLACFLAWGRFRSRFSLEARPRLATFLKAFDAFPPFAETAPRAGS